MRDLDAITPNKGGLTGFTAAGAINEAGQITGRGYINGKGNRAFVATPSP